MKPHRSANALVILALVLSAIAVTGFTVQQSPSADDVPNQPTTKDDCRNGGWRNYPHAGFRNQGDCVSFVSSGRFVCRDPLGCVSYLEDDSLRIATALAISGDVSPLGVDSQRGVEIALARYGEMFDHGIDLRAEDDGCSPEGGQAVANALIADASVAAVVGTSCSGAAHEAAPILSAAGYSMVSPSNTSPLLTDPAAHAAGYLRTAWNDDDNAAAMAEYLDNQGEMTAAVIVERENLYSYSVGQSFVTAFAALTGNTPAFFEVYPDQLEVDSVLDGLGEPPDVLYLPVFEPLGSMIVRGTRDRAALDGTILANNDSLYYEEFLDGLGPYAAGMLFGIPDNSFTQSPAYAAFRQEYLDAYDEEPAEFFSAHAYDAADMILRAIARTGIVDGARTLHIGRQALRSALFATDMMGLTGPIACDEFGDCNSTGFNIIEIPPPELGMIYVGDLADAWNANAYDGVQRAASDFGIVANLYESSGDPAIALQQCADEANAVCVVAGGWLMPDETHAIAQANPEVFFVSLDIAWEVHPDNLRGALFRANEAAYLGGALAGLMTESNLVGTIGGMQIPPVEDFVNGYRNGAQCYNPDVEVLVEYAGEFGNPDLGGDLAEEMIVQGADVIFAPAGQTGEGSVLAAAQAGVWAIGVDTDFYTSVFGDGSVAGSEWLLTSALKRLDNAIYLTVEDWAHGALMAGTVSYGLAEGGVGLADYHEASPDIPDEVKLTIQAVEAGIIDGSIDVSDDCAPPAMGLRVNYGHDWVESFYEAGHEVVVTITDSDGVEKATASVMTEPKDFWGWEPGFQTTPEDWSPGPPDLQPFDWVYAEVDNGVTAQVQLGDIQGTVDIWNDAVTGTIMASWIEEPVPVECLDWGSGAGPSNKDDGSILTNGSDPYGCQWDPTTEWDVQAFQEIGVGYSTPDGHWVANAFHAEHWVMTFTYDLSSAFWSEGTHSYYFASSTGETTEPVSMSVSSTDNGGETPNYESYVLLRPFAQRAWTGLSCEDVPVVHPSQPTRFVWGEVNSESMSLAEAQVLLAGISVQALWDGDAGGWADLASGEIMPFTDAWPDYVCSLTEHP